MPKLQIQIFEAYGQSTQGVWQKGQTTHHTVTEIGYKIGEFHHADDAAFCDLMHSLVPDIITKLDERDKLDACLTSTNLQLASYMRQVNELTAQLKEVMTHLNEDIHGSI